MGSASCRHQQCTLTVLLRSDFSTQTLRFFLLVLTIPFICSVVLACYTCFFEFSHSGTLCKQHVQIAQVILTDVGQLILARCRVFHLWHTPNGLLIMPASSFLKASEIKYWRYVERSFYRAVMERKNWNSLTAAIELMTQRNTKTSTSCLITDISSSIFLHSDNWRPWNEGFCLCSRRTKHQKSLRNLPKTSNILYNVKIDGKSLCSVSSASLGP